MHHLRLACPLFATEVFMCAGAGAIPGMIVGNVVGGWVGNVVGEAIGKSVVDGFY